MKCKQCSKVIPDGFIDCPWCGATGDGGAALAASAFDTIPGPSVRLALTLLCTLFCSICTIFLSYVVTFRGIDAYAYRFNHAYLWGRFVGRCVGWYFLPTLGVFLYYRIRGKNPDWTVRFLVISCWTALFAITGLAVIPPLTRYELERRQLARVSDAFRAEKAKAEQPLPPTKWDPAIHSFYGDLSAFHMQYISAISKLDETASPLYAPDTFRDAVAIKQVLSQLQQRLSVANEFASPEWLLDKMPIYAHSIDSTEEERKGFLDEFDNSTRRNLAARRVMVENERAWLSSSMELYQFVLARQGEYSLQDGKVVFKRRMLSDDFDRKLEIAQLCRLRFLRAYWQFVTEQNRLFIKGGMPSLTLGSSP